MKQYNWLIFEPEYLDILVWQSSVVTLGKDKDHSLSICGIQTAQRNIDQDPKEIGRFGPTDWKKKKKHLIDYF